MSKIHLNRIQKLKSLLQKRYGAAIAVVSSNPPSRRSHDTNYPYRQNSNLFYLTGSSEPGLILLIDTKKKEPILIGPKDDSLRIIWEGAGESLSAIAKRIGASIVATDDPIKECLSKLRGGAVVLSENLPGLLSWTAVQRILNSTLHTQSPYPTTVAHLELAMQELRLYKSNEEVDAIRSAARLTTQALLESAPLITPGATEREIAASISYIFALDGGTNAFQPIVATGASAATLHYHALDKKLKKGEMLLLDVGAELDMYAGDISRTVPVDGEFSPINAAIYEIVLKAQQKAISKVRHGVTILSVYNAAATILVEGLKDLGVLKGKTSSLLAKGAHKPYFPHGIGHSLGLDVHDISNLRGNNDAVLEAGMVFTIEPGLYFSKRTKAIAPCGVRIEDDVLVTKNGATVLSEGFPKDPLNIEELLANARTFRAEHS